MVTTLREMAELRAAATEGPWRYPVGGEIAAKPYERPGIRGHTSVVSGFVRPADAAYIAATSRLSPEAWSALADLVAAARELRTVWGYEVLTADGAREGVAAEQNLRASLSKLDEVLP